MKIIAKIPDRIQKIILPKVRINEDTKLSYQYLIKWVFISSLSGFLGVIVVHSFAFFIKKSYEFLQIFGLPLFLFPVIGAVINGALIYRIEPFAQGEGIPSYIKSLRNNMGVLSIKTTIFKYLAGIATISTFGNGGIVGPVGRVTAGVSSYMIDKLKKLGFTIEDVRTAAICGMAAVVGTIFHSPVGGGIFAVEIIQKDKMGYKDLFPAILSSSSAVYFAKALGFKSFYQFFVVDEFMNLKMIGWLLVLAIIAGLAGGFYTWLYSTISKLIKRESGSIFIKVLTGSIIASLLSWLINPHLLGTSSSFMDAILVKDMYILRGNISSSIPIFIILIIMLLVKSLANCITVGSGMSAGFTGPAAIVGMLIGITFAEILNIDNSTATHFAFIAAGFSGMLASSMNIPIAAAVMTIEIFGLYYSLPAGLSAVIGFQITRNKTIYEYAVKEISSTSEHNITKIKNI